MRYLFKNTRKEINKKLIFLLVCLPVNFLLAQESLNSGQVKSRDFGRPIAGVEVWADGKVISWTDANGKFSVPSNLKEVVLRKAGYLDELVLLTGSNNDCVLQSSYVRGSEEVQMLFNSAQKKKTSVAAVSEVYSNQLIPSNSRSTAGLVSSFVPGVATIQNSAMPTADAVTLSMRGTNPLVILDGVPQSFAAINPEQIESITFLKDAISTSMLGMRAADGVMLIKTKTGEGVVKQQISVRVQSGAYKALNQIRPLNSFEYATLYNEARQNDGLASVYDDQMLETYFNNSNPYSFPNNNWFETIMNDKSRFERYDVSLAGGGKVANYFVNLNYFNQGGLLKKNEEATYNTALGLKKYSFRTNTNINLTENFVAGLNVAGQFQNTNQPGATASTVLVNALNTPSLAYPMFNTDHSLGGTVNYLNNVYGQNFLTGYRVGQQLEYKVDINLKANLSQLVEGLWAKAVGSYYSFMLENVARVKTFEVYQMDVNNIGDTTFNRRGAVQTPMSNSGSVASRSSTMYGDFSVGFDRRFNRHGIGLLANASMDHSRDNSLLPENYKGVALRTQYDFDEKYLFDFAIGYNGVERFAKGKRYGFFPAVGLGWNVAEEAFVKNSIHWLNQFKLRGSYGLTGAVTAGRYTYLGFYERSGSYSFGTTVGNPLSGVSDVSYNPNVTWEKAKKANIGIDFSVLHNLLSGSIEYFDNRFYDLLQAPNSLSALYGDSYPLMNMGKVTRKGFEGQLTHQNNFNQFKYFVQLNYGHVKSINTFYDEPMREFSWQVRTGKTLGSTYGYVAEGLFSTNDEAVNSPTMVGYTAQAGDIRYRDLNKDGVINSDDQTTIGSQKPIQNFGLVAGFNYKNVDFSAGLQGVFNREVLWTGNSVFEFLNNGLGNAYEHHIKRWTPSTAATATYPRLSIGNNSNNQVTSTYWLKRGDFIRLKNIEVGYSLSEKISNRIGIPTIRVFFNGSNLFTWSKSDLVDPESFSNPYPMTSIFSGGINVKF